MMNKYECLFIIDPELGEEKHTGFIENSKICSRLQHNWSYYGGGKETLMRLQTGTRAIMFLLPVVHFPRGLKDIQITDGIKYLIIKNDNRVVV